MEGARKTFLCFTGQSRGAGAGKRKAKNVKLSHVHSRTMRDTSGDITRQIKKDFRSLSLLAQDGLVSEIKRYRVRIQTSKTPVEVSFYTISVAGSFVH